jgi:hypothetical protein
MAQVSRGQPVRRAPAKSRGAIGASKIGLGIEDSSEVVRREHEVADGGHLPLLARRRRVFSVGPLLTAGMLELRAQAAAVELASTSACKSLGQVHSPCLVAVKDLLALGP